MEQITMDFIKPTAKEKILDALKNACKPLSVHEFNIYGCSETAISARLRELTRSGLVIGKVRSGTSFKEWELKGE